MNNSLETDSWMDSKWAPTAGLLVSLTITLTSLAAFAEPVLYPKAEAKHDSNAVWLGVMGDSGTTGAASDVNLQPNLKTLLNLTVEFAKDPDLTDVQPALENHPLAGKIQKFDPPLRIYNSDEESKHEDATRLEAAKKATLRLDVEENAFGYQFAIQNGLQASQVVFVGQDGTRVDSIPTQIARFYAKPADTLPPVVLVGFNANDFCDENIFKDDLGKRVEAFAADLKKAWTDSAPNLKPHPRGTQFVVLSPIEVANVLTNQDVLEQKVQFEGGDMTCRELRETRFEDKLKEAQGGNLIESLGKLPDIAQLEAQTRVQNALIGMCSAVLGTKPDDKDRLARLQQVQSEFREVWRRQLGELNKAYEGKGLSWSFVESIADIKFGKGDTANECFHPSAQGHAKITAELMKLGLKLQ